MLSCWGNCPLCTGANSWVTLGHGKAGDTVPRGVLIRELEEGNLGWVSSLGACWLFPAVCCVKKVFQMHIQNLSSVCLGCSLHGGLCQVWVASALRTWRRHEKNQVSSCVCFFQSPKAKSWSWNQLAGHCHRAVHKPCRSCCFDGLAVSDLQNVLTLHHPKMRLIIPQWRLRANTGMKD